MQIYHITLLLSVIPENYKDMEIEQDLSYPWDRNIKDIMDCHHQILISH